MDQGWRNWKGRIGYLFVDSRLVTGLRVPQVPKHHGSGQLTYQRGGTLIAAGGRSFSFQFDDDRNQFLLPGFATAELLDLPKWRPVGIQLRVRENTRRTIPMEWTTPDFEEVCLSCEISTYANAEF
jgi:coenzyme PQQ precursor peptide PqqA